MAGASLRSLSKLVAWLELEAGLVSSHRTGRKVDEGGQVHHVTAVRLLEGYPVPSAFPIAINLLRRIFSSADSSVLRRPTVTKSLPHPQALTVPRCINAQTAGQDGNPGSLAPGSPGRTTVQYFLCGQKVSGTGQRLYP